MLINVVVSGPSNDGTTFVACGSAEFFELAANGDDAIHSFTETFSSPSTAFFTGPNWGTVSGQQDPSSPSNFNNTVAVASSTTENENITDAQVLTHTSAPIYLPTPESGLVLKVEFNWRYDSQPISVNDSSLAPDLRVDISSYCAVANVSGYSLLLWEKSGNALVTNPPGWRKATVFLDPFRDTFAFDFANANRNVRLAFTFTNPSAGNDSFNGSSLLLLDNIQVNAVANPALNSSTSSSVPSGSVMAWMGTGSEPPTGWLFCDGSLFDTDLYPQLAAVLGTSRVPDLRGRFILSDSPSFSAGSTGGATSVTLSTNNLPPHQHSVGMTFDATFTPGNIQTGSGASTLHFTGAGLGGGSTSLVGSGQAFGIMPPYVAVKHIIKA